MDKIIKVIFEEWQETQFDNTLTQWDYGHTLQVEGVTLPDGNVEVHFSLTEHNGEAQISIGTVKDNVITVDIPDFILAKENTYNSSYEAYAWIYVTDGESGRTIRKIVFTIDTRAEPSTNVPEDQKDKFLQEVRQVLAETKEVAQSVRDDADNGKFNGPQGEQGKQGEPGEQGENGYTPVKGVDYFDGKDGVNGVDGNKVAMGDISVDPDGNVCVNDETLKVGDIVIDSKSYFLYEIIGCSEYDEWLCKNTGVYIKGEQGQDGYTPQKGVDYFDGVDGKDGYTPQKGVDYFTYDDKMEVASEVLKLIPQGDEVSY